MPVERFIDGYQSRNERLADMMRRLASASQVNQKSRCAGAIRTWPRHPRSRQETGAFPLHWIFTFAVVSAFDVAGIDHPSEKRAHQVEEVPGLRGRIRPAVAAGNVMLAGWLAP